MRLDTLASCQNTHVLCNCSSQLQLAYLLAVGVVRFAHSTRALASSVCCQWGASPCAGVCSSILATHCTPTMEQGPTLAPCCNRLARGGAVWGLSRVCPCNKQGESKKQYDAPMLRAGQRGARAHVHAQTADRDDGFLISKRSSYPLDQ